MYYATQNAFEPGSPGWNHRRNLLNALSQRPDLNDDFLHITFDKERFAYALSELLRHDTTRWFDSNCEQKITKKSIKSREDGNKYFRDGQYLKAVLEYTDSVVYATDSSEELPLAYANRSAALFELEKYEDCIKDIDRALNLQYPDRLRAKLYKRKGLCLTRLGSPEAQSFFQEALVWLDKMNLSKNEMSRTKGELQSLISAPLTGAKPSVKLVQYPVPEIHAPNPINPCASDAVTIEYSEKFGRHLVATRKIDPGELLVLEKPYCSRLKYKYIYTHCSECLQKSWSLIPCKCCVNVTYCSETCRDQAWDEYHEIECQAMGLILDYKTGGLLCISMKMAIMATKKGSELDSLREELEDVDLNTDPCTKGFTDDGEFLSSDHRSVYSLSRVLDDECNSQAVFGRSLCVAMVVCILARETTMFGKKLTLDHTLLTNPDVTFIGELILKLQDIAGSNRHSYGSLSKDSDDEFASGIAPFCSLINHSCDANIVRNWNGTHQTIHAIYPIEEGEQIFDDYGAHFCTMTKWERRLKLKNWEFTCACAPCKENWPMIEDIPSYKKQSLSRKDRNKLDAISLELEGRITSLRLTKNVESLTNLMNLLLQTISTFCMLVQRPCKELSLMISIVRGYYWADRELFDFLSKCESEIPFKVLEFYEPLKKMVEHCDTNKTGLVSGLATSDLLAKFQQCKNNDDRYRLALEAVVQNSAILFDSECKQKDSEHSIKSRNDGNQSCAIRQYYVAVQNYTESIVYAVESSQELALAYASRSGALYKLEKFEECIRDIDRALSLQYPDRLKTKLYERKGICFARLGRSGADALFEEALIWVDKTNLSASNMDKSRSNLRKLISTLRTVPELPKNATEFSLPEISNPNPEVPSVSDGVAIDYSDKYGRHLVATREIKPGELLIVGKPYCLMLSTDYLLTHCSYCLRASWDLIPCKRCVHVSYCSNACKDKAWDEYHEIECPVVGFVLDYNLNNSTLMSMRTVIMATRKGMNLDKFRKELARMDRNSDPRTKGFSNDGKFHNNQYCSVYSLGNNMDKYSAHKLLVGALFQAVLVCMLARETKMFKKKLRLDTLASNRDVIFVGQLMWNHTPRVFFNTHKFGATSTDSTKEHGDAFIAILGLLNHSCDPNTIRQCYADGMAVYAAYPIKQGEQIFVDYGTRSVTAKKNERQKVFNRFHFTCECLPCMEDWPLFEDLPSYQMQPLTPRNKSKLDEVLRKFCAQRKESPNELNELSEIIELLFELAQRPCTELAHMLSMLRNYFRAAETVFEYEPGRLSEIEAERSSQHQALQRLI